MWRAIGLVSVIGVDFAVCVVGGFLLGRYVDRWLATDPWFLLVGLISGIVVGSYTVYRLILPYLRG
ncbi:AtpZ/AtpI family protein [Brevibacillus panacihumi]|uniref:AtpZ/AtpI family protein n=1 Tax=Brevibacillus panacihumi TaxID=497735 RepID=A0A3M8D3U4_9BACL|nr:AtpZ/AtpI family protein [Brevibacillus panacihumi]RNB82682.1 AtpZ/AtpI family protein [Brevibacillus panacihumi]HZG81142.1 AtpZ/AtpI family protein [Brevibacillus sp.]